MTEKTIKELINAHEIAREFADKFEDLTGDHLELFDSVLGPIERTLMWEVWVPKTGLAFDEYCDYVLDTSSMIFDYCSVNEDDLYKNLTSGKMLIKNCEDYEDEYAQFGEAIRGTELRPWCDEE